MCWNAWVSRTSSADFESLEITYPETCFWKNIAEQRVNVSGEYAGLVPWGFVLIRVWFCVVLCRARAQLSLSKWSENGGLHWKGEALSRADFSTERDQIRTTANTLTLTKLKVKKCVKVMRNETLKPHHDLRSTMLNTKCNFVGLCVCCCCCMHSVSGKVFFFSFLLKVPNATFAVRLTRFVFSTIIPAEKLQSFHFYSKSHHLFWCLCFVYSKITNISDFIWF